MAKSKQELADLRKLRTPHAAGSELHRFAHNHPRRREDPAVDAVCSRCGLEELDATPEAKKKTARWRVAGTEAISAAKPACLPKPKEVDNSVKIASS